MQFQTYKLKLKVISPIHIGCGDYYEPTNFVIDTETKKLLHFDPLELVLNMDENEKKEFIKVCSDNKILEIYRFINKTFTKHKDKINSIKEVNIVEDLSLHYQEVLQSKQDSVINQFVIEKTIRNPINNLPYIPGSSIKGAIRTAYLSKLALDNGIRNYWETRRDIEDKKIAKELEKELLGGIYSQDPFKFLKVSDFTPITENISTKIVYAINKKKKKSKYKASGPYQILEVISENTEFQGTISVFKDDFSLLSSEHFKVFLNNISNIQNLLKIISSFYYKIYEKENEVFKQIELQNLIPKVQTKPQNVFLIRIGRHSGAEAVTIENNRNIKIQQGRRPPEYLAFATTLWLASKTKKPKNNQEILSPFGWCLLNIEE